MPYSSKAQCPLNEVCQAPTRVLPEALWLRDWNACRLVESLVKEIEWVTKLVTTAADILIWNGVTFIKVQGRRSKRIYLVKSKKA
ncbi:hypothetical protein QQ045_023548 [Rhodiola kirilowii]